MLPTLLIGLSSLTPLLATQRTLSNHVTTSRLDTTFPTFPTQNSWPSAGGGTLNSNFQPDGPLINATTAIRLQVQWSLATPGGFPTAPTIENHSLYVSNSNGTLNKIDTELGSLLWSIPLSDYTGNLHSVSLNSTAIAPEGIVVGDQSSGTLLALHKTTGTLLWKTTIQPSLDAKITSPPTIDEDSVYVSVSSGKSPSSVAALDMKTGKLRWQSYAIPADALIRGPLALNSAKKRLYALTSSNGKVSSLTNTLLVLDTENGTLLWSRNLEKQASTVTDNADNNGVTLFTLQINGTTRDVVAIPEARGHYQVLDANNGTILWSIEVNPGSTNSIVGTSFNPYKSHIYVASNATDPQMHNAHYLTALDAATGTMLWNIKLPESSHINTKHNTGGGIASSPDIVYTSLPGGKITMVNANTGEILSSFDTQASIVSPPVIANDALYLGFAFTDNTGKLYKFTTQENVQISNLQRNQQRSLINRMSEQNDHHDEHDGDGSWSYSGSGSWSGSGGYGGAGDYSGGGAGGYSGGGAGGYSGNGAGGYSGGGAGGYSGNGAGGYNGGGAGGYSGSGAGGYSGGGAGGYSGNGAGGYNGGGAGGYSGSGAGDYSGGGAGGYSGNGAGGYGGGNYSGASRR
ncbi:PQQ-binding-like beta-propeller repeat protein [Xylella taiwanensis]|uniref:PQQ-binding-like beta-propeller repeat protein n=1 Tax=Xylella taiwanensis TaxID=1444770 RepID=UPI001E4E2B06|nr:PQQ-binding-like beta-propeller repeat protein [Xylella taiwanensis]